MAVAMHHRRWFELNKMVVSSMDKKQIIEMLKQHGVKVVGNYVHRDDLRKVLGTGKAQERRSKFKVVKSRFATADSRVLDALKSNKGADEKIVAKAEQVANSGHYVTRAAEIAKAVKSKLAPHLDALGKMMDVLGHKPKGLDELLDSLCSSLLYSMIFDGGWSEPQLKKVAWGLPLEVLEEYGLGHLRSERTPAKAEDKDKSLPGKL